MIKQEAIALFAGLAVLGIMIFIVGLVATNPKEEAERLRVMLRAIREATTPQESRTVIVEPGDESRQLICSVCRIPLKDDYLMCPRCGTVYKKKCPQCGTLHPSGFKICPYCGYKFDTPSD